MDFGEKGRNFLTSVIMYDSSQSTVLILRLQTDGFERVVLRAKLHWLKAY